MAEEAKQEKTDWGKLIGEYRKQLKDRAALSKTVSEGLKSKNAKIRTLAVKGAFRLKDHGFVKSNVLTLLKTEKSKKVLRAISDKITRKDLRTKVQSLKVKKVPGGKKKEEAPAAESAPKA